MLTVTRVVLTLQVSLAVSLSGDKRHLPRSWDSRENSEDCIYFLIHFYIRAASSNVYRQLGGGAGYEVMGGKLKAIGSWRPGGLTSGLFPPGQHSEFSKKAR